MQPGERDQVCGDFAEVRVQLAGEPQRARDPAHGGGDQVVQVAERRLGQLKRPKADVVEGLVVEDDALVRVLDQLVQRQGRVVGLDDDVGDFGRGDDREGSHDAIRVLFADFLDQQVAQTRASATAQGMGHLEALQAVRVLGFLADDVHRLVDNLRAFRVVPLGPAVAGAILPEDHVVGSEELADRRRSHRVNDAGLQVDEDGPGHIAAARGLIVVYIGPFKLQVRFTVVLAGWVNAVLVRNDFPELGADLITALASLNMHNFSHFVSSLVLFSLV